MRKPYEACLKLHAIMNKTRDDVWFLGAMLALFVVTYASFYFLIPLLVNATMSPLW